MFGGRTAGSGFNIAKYTSSHFTPRQAEVVELVASGLSYKQIARHLGASRRTVRTHLERVYERFEVHTRTEAALLWVRFSSRNIE